MNKFVLLTIFLTSAVYAGQDGTGNEPEPDPEPEQQQAQTSYCQQIAQNEAQTEAEHQQLYCECIASTDPE